jgi:hypothetical protein
MYYSLIINKLTNVRYGTLNGVVNVLIFNY